MIISTSVYVSCTYLLHLLERTPARATEAVVRHALLTKASSSFPLLLPVNNGF